MVESLQSNRRKVAHQLSYDISEKIQNDVTRSSKSDSN